VVAAVLARSVDGEPPILMASDGVSISANGSVRRPPQRWCWLHFLGHDSSFLPTLARLSAEAVACSSL
jgi:hypothetical protein